MIFNETKLKGALLILLITVAPDGYLRRVH